jgi:Ni/Co efflux regulator RcnB
MQYGGIFAIQGAEMKSKIIISSIMTVTLLASSAAFAQGHDRGGDHGRSEHAQRGGPGHDRGHPGNSNKYGDKHGYKHDGRHDNGRGAGPKHNFYKGGYIPREYRGHQYVVNDWRSHRLTPPPRGYHWVQTGGDYVLIAISTGLIAQIILSN